MTGTALLGVLIETERGRVVERKLPIDSYYYYYYYYFLAFDVFEVQLDYTSEAGNSSTLRRDIFQVYFFCLLLSLKRLLSWS